MIEIFYPDADGKIRFTKKQLEELLKRVYRQGHDDGYAIESEIKKWIEQMNRVFGRNISIEATSKPVSSVKEDNNGGVQNEETNNQMVFYLKRNCGTL